MEAQDGPTSCLSAESWDSNPDLSDPRVNAFDHYAAPLICSSHPLILPGPTCRMCGDSSAPYVKLLRCHLPPWAGIQQT